QDSAPGAAQERDLLGLTLEGQGLGATLDPAQPAQDGSGNAGRGIDAVRAPAERERLVQLGIAGLRRVDQDAAALDPASQLGGLPGAVAAAGQRGEDEQERGRRRELELAFHGAGAVAEAFSVEA